MSRTKLQWYKAPFRLPFGVMAILCVGFTMLFLNALTWVFTDEIMFDLDDWKGPMSGLVHWSLGGNFLPR